MEQITVVEQKLSREEISLSEPRHLQTFIGATGIKFGDYLLFQEYKHSYDKEGCDYLVSRPLLVIYLGMFCADQTVGFNYVKWNNDNHIERITNQYVTNYKVMKQVDGIHCHIEWDDFVDILGHWKCKPTWKDILPLYRKLNAKTHCSHQSFTTRIDRS